jgi:hypothetical protein
MDVIDDYFLVETGKKNSGDQDINKELMGWGGSCVFLVVSALVIKAFFGL